MMKQCALLVTLASLSALAGPPVGEKPKTVTLEKRDGGRIAGGAWSSDELKGKVCVIFYMDPDAATINNEASAAIQAEKFSPDVYQGIAIVNEAASWVPAFVIEGLLKASQKDFPHTIYVRDRKKVLVKEWKLADDNNDVLAFDKDGKLIFVHEGKLSAADTRLLLETIKQHL